MPPRVAKEPSPRARVKPGIWKRSGADGALRYEITYRDSDGKQRRQVVEGGLRAAETGLSDVKARMGKGERVSPRPNLTFGYVAEEWMAREGATLRPATQAAYRTALDTHLLPAWGSRRLDRIDPSAVADLVERMQTGAYRTEVEQRLEIKKSNRPADVGYKAWTIRSALTPAGRVFDFASERMGWAGTNPVRSALLRRKRPRIEQRERRILSRAELTRLLAAADEPHRTILATAAGLGTRFGETLGLTWGDIDFDAGTATVRFQVDRRGERVELKTARSRRVIELPGSVIAALRAHKLRSTHTRDEDFLFTTRTGQPIERRNVARRGLQRAHLRAKLKGRCPSFHDLRHAHASAWIAGGGDLVELSSRLGHRDPAITASTYSHEFEAAARSAERRARLDSIYGADEADERGSIVAAPGVSGGRPSKSARPAKVFDLQAKRNRQQ